MATPPDPRLEGLVELVVQLASGNLDARMSLSAASDDIDAVIVGVNMLAEELQALNKHLEGRVAERTRQLADAHLQLERLALYDPLTDLANRMLLADRIDHAVAGAGRGGDPPAVLVLDLDGFKAVNDSFGHAVGDQLLVEVARRLRAVSRATDTVARLGGDEFALLVVDADRGAGPRRRRPDHDRAAGAGARGQPEVLGERQHRGAVLHGGPDRRRSAARRRHGHVRRQGPRTRGRRGLRADDARRGAADGCARPTSCATR